LQAEQTSPTIPTKANQSVLVKRSMHDFGLSVSSKTMEHFRSTVSQLWQRQFTTEKLNEVFGKTFDVGLDFTVFDRIEPIIEPVVALGEHGELVLKGYFPTKPKQMHFEQNFIYEGVDWKLFGFSIETK
jgi:hypothetical protein